MYPPHSLGVPHIIDFTAHSTPPTSMPLFIPDKEINWFKCHVYAGRWLLVLFRAPFLHIYTALPASDVPL